MICIVFGVTLLIAGFILLVMSAAEDLGGLGLIIAFLLMFGGIAFVAISPCSDCGVRLCDCECSETVCTECGQMLPESDKECNHKEPVGDLNKCCDTCGQEIVVNVEVNCEHTASVEIETTPETVKPESTKPVVPNCPNCKKSVTSPFCPGCGYDMYATESCPSCDKEFAADKVPSYCPDCGEKITDN